ncbi:NAD-dependent deacylase [Nitratireductor mangrovi]|uniref:NAD-dependent protein deacylase n=1 Tax=Nitratireductor mangrovi TaxID=2599600 RepID=A0A5B8KY66_9HYPH|nr:NAD-dependent deacylase [Nitratireductor mangrovi]QDZ00501.1 NAD-dependent deacylase [Nitratireductor mangrovi]
MTPSSIVILTGAGISAESGVDTFRDKDGIWSKIDYRDVATPEGFARDPAQVHDFYNQRRRGMTGVTPNPAHAALAELERRYDGDFLLVTQNIDDLHERAGSRKLIHMHGELARALCANCGNRQEWNGDLSVELACPSCNSPGFMRPDVVWFGEMPYHMERIYEALGNCDLFVAIGTSGTVYPAAGFNEEARMAGAHTVELNLEATEGSYRFAETQHGKASEIVPAFVERVLGRG